MGKEANIILNRQTTFPQSVGERLKQPKKPRESYAEKISGVFDDIRQKGYSTRQPFSIGRVEKRMKDYASSHSVNMANGGLFMSYSSLAHATRASKQKSNVAVSETELVNFPSKRDGMDLYYDKKDNLFVYVDEPNKAKFVIHPDYELSINRKKHRKVNFITASRLNSTENFQKDRTRYDKI